MQQPNPETTFPPKKAFPKVAILMATYNGAAYLDAQIDSILRQTYTHWTLYVQDDLSTDDTPDILRRRAASEPRIHIVENSEKLGPMQNFAHLAASVEADAYFFADQDDVWLEDKVELTLSRLAEESWPRPDGTPIAVCTDLRVVDAQLREIGPSFWKMQRIEPRLLTTFDALGAHCFATGCTLAFNRAARDTMLPIPPAALMHDVWLVLRVKKAGGIVAAIERPTMLYRQHGRNTIGATDQQHHFLRDKLLSLRRVLSDNIAYYRMLRAVGYGSPLKFLANKWRYHRAYNAIQKKE